MGVLVLLMLLLMQTLLLLRRLFPATADADVDDVEHVEEGDGAGLDQSPPDLDNKKIEVKHGLQWKEVRNSVTRRLIFDQSQQ